MAAALLRAAVRPGAQGAGVACVVDLDWAAPLLPVVGVADGSALLGLPAPAGPLHVPIASSGWSTVTLYLAAAATWFPPAVRRPGPPADGRPALA
jgi:hypothetical protein